MYKKIFSISLMLILIVICQSEAATTYNFDFTENYSGEGIIWSDQVSSFSASISGNAGEDWVIGTIDPRYDNFKWFFDQGVTGDRSFFGGADGTFPPTEGTIIPLVTGTVLTIISLNDDPLILTNFVARDYGDDLFSGTTASASLNAVPIPSTIFLLGGGLIGLVALRRRRT